MTKTEFLENLRIALNGKVSDSLLRENMAYYNEYIDSQLSVGNSEADIMEALGDPRLIARTIVQTNGMQTDASDKTCHCEGNNSDTVFDDMNDQNGYYGGQNQVKVRTLPGWLIAVIIVLIIVCLISLAFKVVSLLLPLLLPVLIIVFFVKLFRDWLN